MKKLPVFDRLFDIVYEAGIYGTLEALAGVSDVNAKDEERSKEVRDFYAETATKIRDTLLH